MHNIVIADARPLVRQMIATAISQHFDGIEITEKDNLQSTITYAEENPDVALILLNLDMPSMNGLNGMFSLRSGRFDVPVLIISVEDDQNITLQAVTLGATCFTSSSMQREKITDAIGQILDGQVYMPSDIFPQITAPKTGSPRVDANANTLGLISSLTYRQLLVFKYVSQGDSNKQIAYKLKITEATVKAHVSAILRTLKVHSRVQAVVCTSTINFDHYLDKYDFSEGRGFLSDRPLRLNSPDAPQLKTQF